MIQLFMVKKIIDFLKKIGVLKVGVKTSSYKGVTSIDVDPLEDNN